jgi:hypothetical protein
MPFLLYHWQGRHALPLLPSTHGFSPFHVFFFLSLHPFRSGLSVDLRIDLVYLEGDPGRHTSTRHVESESSGTTVQEKNSISMRTLLSPNNFSPGSTLKYYSIYSIFTYCSTFHRNGYLGLLGDFFLRL